MYEWCELCIRFALARAMGTVACPARAWLNKLGPPHRLSLELVVVRIHPFTNQTNPGRMDDT
jgi:hypothetical protein